MTNDPAEINPYAAPTTDIASGPAGARGPAALRISAGVILILDAGLNVVRALSQAIGRMLLEVATATDLLWALFMVLVAATAATAAVFLFQNKRPGFIVATALLAGVAEIIAAVMYRPAWLTLFGSGAALLAFIAGVSIANRTPHHPQA